MPESDVRQLVSQYLQGKNIDPNDPSNISRALNAASVNPGLIPGLALGGSGEYSPGDPRTGGMVPGNAPTPGALPIARPRVSAPIRPQTPSAPTGDDVDILGNTIARGLPPTGTPRGKNEGGGSVPQGASNVVAPTQPTPPADDGSLLANVPPAVKSVLGLDGVQVPPNIQQRLDARAQPPSQPAQPTPTPQVSEDEPTPPVGNPRPMAYTGPPSSGPTASSEMQHVPTKRNNVPAELPSTWSQRLGVTSPAMSGAIDLAQLYKDKYISLARPADQSMTPEEHKQQAMAIALGIVGGGTGRAAAGETGMVRQPPALPRKPVVPSVDANAAHPFGKPPPPEPPPATSKELAEQLKRKKLQDEIDNFSPGSSSARPTPQPQPTPTQAAPGAQGSPTAQAESPTTSTASRPVQMPPPPVHASGNTVPLSQITGGGQDILYTGRPTNVPPMPPDAVAPVVSTPTPQPPFQGARYGTSMKMQQPPTPIRGEVTGGETNAYNIPGTDAPITPTVAPTRTSPPTSVPPPVNVAAPTNAPMPVPPSATVPPQLLDELTRLIEGGFPSRPVAVPAPGAPPGASRAIPIGTEPPMVQAINARRQAGPRKELTSSDVKQPRNVAQEMAERLRRK